MYLYITDPQTKVYFKDNQIIAEDKNEILTKVPIENVEGVVLVGALGVSMGCQKELLLRGIPLSLLSSTGQYFGRLESTSHVNIKRQRQQMRLGDNQDFTLKLSKQILNAKVHNQLVILRRYQRERKIAEVDKCIRNISFLQQKIQNTDSIEQAEGYEGICARHYFSALAQIVPTEYSFKGRNKQPPKDKFNSLLSFGYTLLHFEIFTALENKGLNAYAGFMHQDKQGHPALASDMMEEWRAVIIDSLVLSMIGQGKFTAEDFDYDKDNKGVYLNKKACKIFIREYEKKIRTTVQYFKEVNAMSFRRAIQYQTNRLAKAIDEGDAAIYEPLWIR